MTFEEETFRKNNWSHFGHTDVRKTVFLRFPNDLLLSKNGFVMRFFEKNQAEILRLYSYEPEGWGFESLLACHKKTA